MSFSGTDWQKTFCQCYIICYPRSLWPGSNLFHWTHWQIFSSSFRLLLFFEYASMTCYVLQRWVVIMELSEHVESCLWTSKNIHYHNVNGHHIGYFPRQAATVKVTWTFNQDLWLLNLLGLWLSRGGWERERRRRHRFLVVSCILYEKVMLEDQKYLFF